MAFFKSEDPRVDRFVLATRRSSCSPPGSTGWRGRTRIAIAKADRMREVIEELGGTVLYYVDTPIADTSNGMPTLTTALLQKYGDACTHSPAINDIYFDFMGPSLASAGITGDGAPKAVAAGDGYTSPLHVVTQENIAIDFRSSVSLRARRLPTGVAASRLQGATPRPWPSRIISLTRPRLVPHHRVVAEQGRHG